MKKIIFSLFLFLFSIVVSADEITAVKKKYIISIGDEFYSAEADYSKVCDSDKCEYQLIDNGVKLFDKNNEVVDVKSLSQQGNFMDYYLNMGFNVPSTHSFNDKTFNDDSAMAESLPKFFEYGGNIYVYTYNKALLDSGNYQDFDLNVIMKEIYGDDFDSVKLVHSVTEKKLEDFEHSYEKIDLSTVGTLTSNEFIRRAKELDALLKKVTDIAVCTEDDLNAIRTQRMVSFLELGANFKAPLSSACYGVIFSSGGLYDKAFTAHNEVKIYSHKDSAYAYTMSYLFFETYYQKAYSFLTGSAMQVEPSEVVECGFLGEKTVKLLQDLFDIFKIGGIVIGILLGTIDIFKAIVGNDGAVKKNLQTLMKRLVAIVALMLTPFLIELIFDIVNTIGVTNPICGIR